MKSIKIFLFELKHFLRNPFKVVAFGLFLIAGIYGLNNGAQLYEEQQTQISKIKEKSKKDIQDIVKYYDNGEVGPKNRPWVNYTEPFWAIWSANTYKFKNPSPAMVYSIGQAEQYGFYKRVTFMSSPYDTDMAEEIANPERLQYGTLDFAFVMLFLLPLLLLILTYNIKSYESEQGFLALILVQSASKNSWLISRILFYVILIALAILALIFYGAYLTDVFSSDNNSFNEILLLPLGYLLFWSVLFTIILFRGKSILGNTLQMVGLYLIFTFIIPASVHQWVSIEKPTNLMTNFIDAKRDKKQDLYDLSDEEAQRRIFELYPELENSVIAKDSIKVKAARSDSYSALTNQLMKESIAPIQKESEEKNSIIKSTYWFNPVVFFQNTLNKKTGTHYQDYQQYRDDIQMTIDNQINSLVPDTYNGVIVNKESYLNYVEKFSIDK